MAGSEGGEALFLQLVQATLCAHDTHMLTDTDSTKQAKEGADTKAMASSSSAQALRTKSRWASPSMVMSRLVSVPRVTPSDQFLCQKPSFFRYMYSACTVFSYDSFDLQILQKGQIYREVWSLPTVVTDIVAVSSPGVNRWSNSGQTCT